MTPSSADANHKETVFGQFFAELEEARDRPAVVTRFARDYPLWAQEFQRELALEQVLQHVEEAPDEAVPELPDFHILREVDRGGMGVVYEAEQVSLGRRVAVKVCRKMLAPAQQARFEREQRVLAHLHQTNIVPVHTAGYVAP